MLAEINQSHETRRPLLVKLEELLNRNVITYFTSNVYPVTIDDMDNDMIEGLLQVTDKNKGLSLILNSRGGSALAAERIINTCRTYSNGDFEVIVPRMAKSAATMICMGANKIWMSPTAELGPIDPQFVIVTEQGMPELRGAHYLIRSYEKLFKGAAKAKGNLEPYLQQLQRQDARNIEEYRRAVELAEDIAIKSLQAGMMKGKGKNTIKKMLEPFIRPEQTMTHGRPIYLEGVNKAGLVAELIDIDSEYWKCLWDLYLRSERYVGGKYSKLCESIEDSFHIQAPSMSMED